MTRPDGGVKRAVQGSSKPGSDVERPGLRRKVPGSSLTPPARGAKRLGPSLFL